MSTTKREEDALTKAILDLQPLAREAAKPDASFAVIQEFGRRFMELPTDAAALSLPATGGGALASVPPPADAELLAKLESVLREASDERYGFLKEREKEAEKWKSEGDMYGWNFHQGMAAGANWCDIFYRRVLKAVEAARIAGEVKS